MSGKGNTEIGHLRKVQLRLELWKLNALHPTFKHTCLQLSTPLMTSDTSVILISLHLLCPLGRGPCHTPTPGYEKYGSWFVGSNFCSI